LRVTVALESSGTYGDAFRQAVADAGLTVQRVAGKAAKDYAEVFDGVPSQHDGKDAAILAELGAYGKAAPWPWQTASDDEQRLSYHVDLLDLYQRQWLGWVNRIEAWLGRHWPEATGLLELGGRDAAGTVGGLRQSGGDSGRPAGGVADGRLGRLLPEAGED
jgi:hypothetical protein